jgi:hypothetical protein
MVLSSEGMLYTLTSCDPTRTNPVATPGDLTDCLPLLKIPEEATKPNFKNSRLFNISQDYTLVSSLFGYAKKPVDFDVRSFVHAGG